MLSLTRLPRWFHCHGFPPSAVAAKAGIHSVVGTISYVNRDKSGPFSAAQAVETCGISPVLRRNFYFIQYSTYLLMYY